MKTIKYAEASSGGEKGERMEGPKLALRLM